MAPAIRDLVVTYLVCQQSGVPLCGTQVLSVPNDLSLHLNAFTNSNITLYKLYSCHTGMVYYTS